MFERRLKWLLLILALPTAVVMARLVQLQVFRTSYYQQEAHGMLLRGPRYYPCLRGDITDRAGRSLAYDAPAWDICVHYGVLAGDHDYLKALERKKGTFYRSRQVDEDLLAEIADSWRTISELTGMPPEELNETAERICGQVRRVKELVSARRGLDTVVMEERMAHPVARDLTQEQQVAARVRLAAYEWVEVAASHRREYTGGEPFGHLLGRMGEVGPSTIEQDIHAGDDLAGYLAGELHGVSGLEELGEQVLRGRRGRVHEDIEGQAIRPPVEPENGRSFRLTIDQSLQQALYDRLAGAVEASPFRTGGCAVVLYPKTRQILAMVDYPSIDPAAPLEVRQEAGRDRARQPLLFRAVREYYPPGSLVKPMILAAALSDRQVTSQTQFTCYGKLFQDHPGWGCTGTHGSIGPVFAVQHSCNVYFFHIAQILGVARLSDWMSQFGLGSVAGTGLVGEMPGRLPTSQSRGQARNMGIGQGELDTTPLQVANMMACIATGEYRPVTLWLDDPAPREARRLSVRLEHWRLVREGIYKAVNEPGGTAFGSDKGTLDDTDFVLLGKTGSAEVVRGRTVETLFVCHFPDGRVEEIIAPDRDTLMSRFTPEERVSVKVAGWRSYRRFPPDPPEPYTHAWFAGYLAPRGRPLDDVSDDPAGVVIAVVIEYTGHGGEIAAPVARDMLHMILYWSRNQPPASASAGDLPSFRAATVREQLPCTQKNRSLTVAALKYPLTSGTAEGRTGPEVH